MSRMLLLYSTILVSLVTLTAHGQDTLERSGCSFVTGDSVYNIHLSRGVNQQVCQSTQSLNDQFKEAQGKNMEIAYEVMQLQGMVLRLMEANRNLSSKVNDLQEDLRITREALQLHQAGKSVSITFCSHHHSHGSDLFAVI